MENVKRYSAQELIEAIRNLPGTDPWECKEDGTGLVHQTNGYEIDFERCKTSAAVLDWIMQVAGKQWADDTTLAMLVRAFEYHLDPQRTLCSDGIERGPVEWTPDNIQ